MLTLQMTSITVLFLSFFALEINFSLFPGVKLLYFSCKTSTVRCQNFLRLWKWKLRFNVDVVFSRSRHEDDVRVIVYGANETDVPRSRVQHCLYVCCPGSEDVESYCCTHLFISSCASIHITYRNMLGGGFRAFGRTDVRF